MKTEYVSEGCLVWMCRRLQWYTFWTVPWNLISHKGHCQTVTPTCSLVLGALRFAVAFRPGRCMGSNWWGCTAWMRTGALCFRISQALCKPFPRTCNVLNWRKWAFGSHGGQAELRSGLGKRGAWARRQTQTATRRVGINVSRETQHGTGLGGGVFACAGGQTQRTAGGLGATSAIKCSRLDFGLLEPCMRSFICFGNGRQGSVWWSHNVNTIGLKPFFPEMATPFWKVLHTTERSQIWQAGLQANTMIGVQSL